VTHNNNSSIFFLVNLSNTAMNFMK